MINPTTYARLTDSEKIDIIFQFNLRAFDHLEGGKVSKLKSWIQYQNSEIEKYKQEITELKRQLTKEKKRATFYHTTADGYRQQVEKLIAQTPNRKLFKKSLK